MLLMILVPVGVLTVLGIVFGAGLAWAGNVFGVVVDPRIEKIRDVLPGANCGACGHPGCDGLAAAIAREEAQVTACPVGGTACANRIADIMDLPPVEEMIPMVATVICQGEQGVCHSKYRYADVQDCRAAALASGGEKSCRYACLGLGTCMQRCVFGAIHMENGIAVIDPDKCTGCAHCTTGCPKNVLRMLPRERTVSIRCRATEKGKAVRDICKAGCITCNRCFKACEHDAIVMKDGLPTIDFEKCVLCGACATACPTGAMHDTRKAGDGEG